MLVNSSLFLLLALGTVFSTLAAPLFQTSGPPCNAFQLKGTIQIVDYPDRSNVLGLISQGTNPYGGYATTQISSDALHVKLLPGCDPADPFEILILASRWEDVFADLPLFGAVVGLDSTSDDITTDSANHAYVAGTFFVPRGPAHFAFNTYTEATGREVDVQSAIWTLPNSLAVNTPIALVPSWVNTNGSVASDVSLVYVPSADGLVLTGNVDDFAAQFGSDVQVVTFEFIPDDL
ncbi:hypothetical protein GY45DRAFT_1312784 [Cubamyces sp. BRFM 1775]|nr:hypothetical protein GY45DRAFT_1312784 [Cubamyces sp. BRFM 1775]